MCCSFPSTANMHLLSKIGQAQAYPFTLALECARGSGSAQRKVVCGCDLNFVNLLHSSVCIVLMFYMLVMHTAPTPSSPRHTPGVSAVHAQTNHCPLFQRLSAQLVF